MVLWIGKELNMNPFDDPDGEFLVPVDDEGQHSLWPNSIDVLGG
jgi:MbtH protein